VKPRSVPTPNLEGFRPCGWGLSGVVFLPGPWLASSSRRTSRVRSLLLENLSGSHLCQSQHNPGVAEHGVGPIDPSCCLQHCKVLGTHLHVDLNCPPAISPGTNDETIFDSASVTGQFFRLLPDRNLLAPRMGLVRPAAERKSLAGLKRSGPL
jgi:hypothetical protein